MKRVALRIGLAQINATVGDLPGNAAKILKAAVRARAAGAGLVLFPEMALTGYPPEDLLLQAQFLRDARSALRGVARKFPRGIVGVVGFPEEGKGKRPKGEGVNSYNAAAILRNGAVEAVYRKRRLPNYGVFDEKRYFTAGGESLIIKIGGVPVGVTICEDLWAAGGPAREAAGKGAKLLVNLSASPYHAGKLAERIKMLRERVKECGVPLAYCNMVGGQDELVFDGASLVMDARGGILARAPQFEEALLVTGLFSHTAHAPVLSLSPLRERAGVRGAIAKPLSHYEEIYSALTLGLRDYARKNGFQQAVVGLSGGIDSSLVACLAADALGKENVTGVTMPSRFNAAATRSDAARLAKNLGLAFHEIPIEGIVGEYTAALAALFAGRPRGLAEENLQARVRGTLLMALSNKFGSLVLTTGNKSETSAGYCTLYGDTAGGLAVIKDIPKKLVYGLSRWRNEKEGRELIPRSVFDRPPTAELRPHQKDQDTLPPYDVLDKIITLYVEENRGFAGIVRAGVSAGAARKVLRMIDASEYKRRQAPPGIKITTRAFGRDRRMPITNQYASRSHIRCGKIFRP